MFHWTGLHPTDIPTAIGPEDYFSWTVTALNVALTVFIGLLNLAIGRCVGRFVQLNCTNALSWGVGFVLFMVPLFMLFAARLLEPHILLAYFVLCSLLVRKELTELLAAGLRVLVELKPRWSWFFYLPLSLPLSFFILNAISPVAINESMGDVAGHYLVVPLRYAQSGGFVELAHVQNQVANLHLNALLASLVVFAHPSIIKLIGLMVFFGTAFLVHDNVRALGGNVAAKLATLLFFTIYMDKYCNRMGAPG